MLDGDPFPILYRHCAIEFAEIVGNLKAGKVVRCPRCASPYTQVPRTMEWMLSDTGKPDLDHYLSRFRRPH